MAHTVGQTRLFVARSVGDLWRAGTSKSGRELGMASRPMQESIEEMVQQVPDAGTSTRA